MREEQPAEIRLNASRFSDQNQPPKSRTSSTNPLKQRSSWGSNIVKGFTHDKKTKTQTTIIDKKPPLGSSDVLNQKNTMASSNSRVKRSLMGDLSCSVSSSQVHPLRRQSSGSRDLFNELDQLRSLLQESKEREIKLQEEISVLRKNQKVSDLEMELEAKKTEVQELQQRLELLESEKVALSVELAAVNSTAEGNGDLAGKKAVGSLEMEVMELRRLNKELQMEKRSLACKVSSMESQLASFAKDNESEIVAKFKAETSMLRHTNEELCKQVEGLQMSRLNEVEELAYLRWVNSCLRDELRNSCTTTISEKLQSPSSVETTGEIVKSAPRKTAECLENSSGSRVKLIKKLNKWPITEEDLSAADCLDNDLDKSWEHLEDGRSPTRRHSISGSKCCIDEMLPNKRRQSDVFLNVKEMEKETATPVSQNQDPDTIQRPHFLGSCQESNMSVTCFDVKRRTRRIPNPPPRPSCSVSNGAKEEDSTQMPPPPPPPPPPPLPPPRFAAKNSSGEVQRAPQVVELYHSLMKRDSRRDSTSGAICEVPNVANVRSSMIGEIENRSSHLLAIKADVETQGEFVNSLIKEVKNAVYQNIEDVVAFVKWLDDELCFLVDERAVLKHFDWPEKKADTMREAAFGYRDLKNLENEVSYYKDDPKMPCDLALKKMVALSEKMERSIYNLQRNREFFIHNCKRFEIPTDWMLDNGIVSKIKLGSVKLAKKYMKRVALELQSKAGCDKDPSMDYMLLQGVRFAFRIHQFAGGFDAETMHAFEELRNLANLLNKK